VNRELFIEDNIFLNSDIMNSFLQQTKLDHNKKYKYNWVGLLKKNVWFQTNGTIALDKITEICKRILVSSCF